MQYTLCPRCKFRVPLNKHMCGTCGFTMASSTGARGVNDTLGPNPKRRTAGFWEKFFGLETPAEEHKEPGHEEPALG